MVFENENTYTLYESCYHPPPPVSFVLSLEKHLFSSRFIVRLCILLIYSISRISQTEQIRRVNRLFASDSLFLRQFLMVPVDRDTSLQHNNQFTKSSSLPASTTLDEMTSDLCSGVSQFAVAAGESTMTATAMPNAYAMPNSDSSPTANVKIDNLLSPEEENKKSIEDFLGKIDSNLAKTKKYVKNRYV